MEHAADERFLGTATKVATPMSPLRSALNEQGEQLDKLASLVELIHERTRCLRAPTPERDSKEGVGIVSEHSEVVHDLGVNTSRIKSLQGDLSSLLTELEV